MPPRSLAVLATLLLVAASAGCGGGEPRQQQSPLEQVEQALGVAPPAPASEGDEAEQGGESAAAGGEAASAEAAGDEPAATGPVPGELLEIDLEGPLLSASTWQRLGRDLLDKLIDFLPALVRALIVLVAFYLVYRGVIGVVRRLTGRANADPAVREIGLKLLRYAFFGFAAIMALAQLGFDVGSMLAGLGIVGLAVGLAAQETLANLIAGLTILWDRPFRIGDNVTIAGTFGQVKQIGMRATRIMTVDRLDAIVPNKSILDEQIINHTSSPQLRLPVPVGIAYKEDSRKAREVLIAAVADHPLILDEPAPAVVVKALGESSVDLELRVWLRDPYTEREALFEMTELAKIALDDAGIEIPFPQRTLHFPAAVRVATRPDERLGGGGGGNGGGPDRPEGEDR
jgi:small conductance mechanosensitive channel